MLNKHANEQMKWKEDVEKTVKRFPERKDFKTSSGIPVERLYGKDDPNYDLGFPGQYPYLRGIQPTMYRSRLWTMRQYAGFGSAAETNKRFRYLFEQGTLGFLWSL